MNTKLTILALTLLAIGTGSTRHLQGMGGMDVEYFFGQGKLREYEERQWQATRELLKAVKTGDLAAAKRAVADGAFIDARSIPSEEDPSRRGVWDWTGFREFEHTASPLNQALANGHLEIAKYLIACGAKITPKTNKVYGKLLLQIPLTHKVLGLFYTDLELFNKLISHTVAAKGAAWLDKIIAVAKEYNLKDAGSRLTEKREYLRTLLQKKEAFIGEKLPKDVAVPPELVQHIVSYAPSKQTFEEFLQDITR